MIFNLNITYSGQYSSLPLAFKTQSLIKIMESSIYKTQHLIKRFYFILGGMKAQYFKVI